MGKYEVYWPMGRVPTGRAPHQLNKSPFKYLNQICVSELGKCSFSSRGADYSDIEFIEFPHY